MKIDPLPDYEKYTDEEGKFQKYGSKTWNYIEF